MRPANSRAPRLDEVGKIDEALQIESFVVPSQRCHNEEQIPGGVIATVNSRLLRAAALAALNKIPKHQKTEIWNRIN